MNELLKIILVALACPICLLFVVNEGSDNNDKNKKMEGEKNDNKK